MSTRARERARLGAVGRTEEDTESQRDKGIGALTDLVGGLFDKKEKKPKKGSTPGGI